MRSALNAAMVTRARTAGTTMHRATIDHEFKVGLTKKCSAAGQTDDGLEPGEQCKPAHTAGPLQRLVRPHVAVAACLLAATAHAAA